MPARMIIAMLLALLISIPAIAQDINSQLVEAAKNGDTVSIKALLEAGADVNTTDANDRTALIWAAQKGHTETAQALLEAGADLNAWDRVYETTACAVSSASCCFFPQPALPLSLAGP